MPQIHSPLLLGIGLALLVLGISLWRWAARHRISLRAAAMSSAYAAVRGGKVPTLPDELKTQFDRVAAAQGNVGRAKVVGGSVFRHLLARIATLAAIGSLVAGVASIAFSVLWK